MAKAQKRKVKGGRVTPKGGPPKPGMASSTAAASGTSRSAPTASARYTPPVPKELQVSPRWVPVLMFALLALGVVIILGNYVEVLPTWGFLPDGTSNGWLLVGLAFILGGIITATQWR